METQKLKDLLTEAMSAEAERAAEIITEVVNENDRLESGIATAITDKVEANSRYSELREKYIKRFMNPATDIVDNIEGEKPDSGEPETKMTLESIFKFK